jgi:RNase P/RNase MRP subunit p29
MTIFTIQFEKTFYMKTTILLTALIFSTFHLFGQQIKIVTPGDLTTDISGTTVEVVGDKDDQEIYYDFRVINETANPLVVKYRRFREVNSERTDQICDSKICFLAANTYTYTTPVFDTLHPSVPTLFKPQIMPGGIESCAVHNYFVVGEFGQIYDSIRVIFKTTNANCELSITKQENLEFSLYPNPAQDIVTIRGEAIKNGGTVVFLDALGKEVKRSSVSGSDNQINVSTLKRGVYFVNILNQNGTKSTVQRLIKQ